jgi:hypothetical protein
MELEMGIGIKEEIDTYGRHVFTEVLKTKDRVKLSFTGGVWTSSVVSDGETLSEQTGKAKLKLTDSKGMALDNVGVYLLTDEGQNTGKKVVTGRGDTSGEACFNMLPGVKYRYRVVHNGGTLVVPAPADPALMVTDGIEICTEVSTVATALILTDKAKRSAGAWVYLVKADGSHTDLREKTDSRGFVAFEILPNFAHRLKTRVNGKWSTTDELIGKSSAVLNIQHASSETTAEEEADTFVLEQNYPNPFKSSTTIRYTIAEAMKVRLVIYNLRGQPIRQLVHAAQRPGVYTVVWDGKDALGRDVSGGVYLYRLKAKNKSVIKKMLFSK